MLIDLYKFVKILQSSISEAERDVIKLVTANH